MSNEQALQDKKGGLNTQPQPAVTQGEPVAWLDLSKMSASAMVYATGWKSNDKQSPLYAAPAPAPAPAQEPPRPQNCGTSYCSCIECVYEPPQPVTLTDGPPQQFVEWLEREMPKNTVIGDPSWWAPRIYHAIIAALREKKESA